MANARMRLSRPGYERLSKVMVELDLGDIRPAAMRLAFAKGLFDSKTEPPAVSTEKGWEIPPRVIAVGDEYTLFKHLMIEKLGFSLKTEQVDEYLVRYMEYGLLRMEQEIDSIHDMDNYLLQLLSQLSGSKEFSH